MKKAIQIQHDSTMERMFRAASDAGFEYISLGFGSSKVFHENGWENEIERVKSLLIKYNLKCVQTHAPYYHLLISSEIADDEMETAIKRCITATGMLGADRIALHPRSSVNYNYSRQKSLEDNRKYVLDYLKTAEKDNVIICLENLPVFPGLTGGFFYSSDCEDLCELADSLNSKNVGICWDFGHAALTRTDQVQALKMIGDRLKCTHVHNNYGHEDDHFVPYLGTIEWEKIMPVLGEIKYNGPLTLEINYTENDMLESYIAHSYSCIDYLSKLIKD